MDFIVGLDLSNMVNMLKEINSWIFMHQVNAWGHLTMDWSQRFWCSFFITLERHRLSWPEAWSVKNRVLVACLGRRSITRWLYLASFRFCISSSDLSPSTSLANKALFLHHVHAESEYFDRGSQGWQRWLLSRGNSRQDQYTRGLWCCFKRHRGFQWSAWGHSGVSDTSWHSCY